MKDETPVDIEKVFDDGKAIDRALKKAVREALKRHQQAGNPIAEWRDGKVVWIKPENILARSKRKQKSSGRMKLAALKRR